MKMIKYFSVISNSKPREAESRGQSFKDRHRWLLLRRRESVCEIEKEEALELEERERSREQSNLVREKRIKEFKVKCKVIVAV